MTRNEVLMELIRIRRSSGFHDRRCDALRWPAFGLVHDCSCDLPGLWA